MLGRDGEAGAARAEHIPSRPSRALHPADRRAIPNPEEHFAMAKTIAYDEEARRGLERGLNALADRLAGHAST